MTLKEMTPTEQARLIWSYYCKAYKVHEATTSKKIKLACRVMGYHMHGKQWCDENGHIYREIDEIDLEIIDREYKRLLNEGVIKP